MRCGARRITTLSLDASTFRAVQITRFRLCVVGATAAASSASEENKRSTLSGGRRGRAAAAADQASAGRQTKSNRAVTHSWGTPIDGNSHCPRPQAVGRRSSHVQARRRYLRRLLLRLTAAALAVADVHYDNWHIGVMSHVERDRAEKQPASGEWRCCSFGGGGSWLNGHHQPPTGALGKRFAASLDKRPTTPPGGRTTGKLKKNACTRLLSPRGDVLPSTSTDGLCRRAHATSALPTLKVEPSSSTAETRLDGSRPRRRDATESSRP